jgi:hypothetical protein
MDTNNFLNELNGIQKAEVPPFLFDRIAQKISESKKEWIPVRILCSVAVSFIILLIINIYAIRQMHSPAERNLAQTFQLMPNNNLY